MNLINNKLGNSLLKTIHIDAREPPKRLSTIMNALIRQ